tara:strand:- start:215 stop:331 length:117 start_codon:yes stop_codon:yes gene_type:complete
MRAWGEMTADIGGGVKSYSFHMAFDRLAKTLLLNLDRA